MASITKRGVHYRVQIRRRGHKPVVKSFRTHALAQRWAREMEHRLETAGLPSEADLGALIRRYKIEVYGAQPRPKAGLKHYDRLAIDLSGVRVAELTASWWLQWARGLNVKPASRMRYLTEITSALKTAEALWGVVVPWQQVRAGRVLLERQGLVGHGRQRQRRVTDEELNRIKGVWGGVLPLPDIIDFALLTAMRQAEITRILWTDVDEDKRMVLVRDRKHPRHKIGNHGWVPLLGDAWAVLQRQPRADARIFPWASASLGDAYERSADRAGVEGTTFHDLRHEAATRLFEAGYGVAEVALVTGHRDWSVLRRYTHLRPESLHDGPVSRKEAPAGLGRANVGA